MTKAMTTVSETTTPTGERGWRIECTCATHKPGQTAAVVKRHADAFDRKLVHGTVLGLHTDGLMRLSSARKGKGWPA
jgi:hypothetical protein